METKSFLEWEKQKHYIHTQADDSMQNSIMTEAEFDAIVDRDHPNFIMLAVHHDDRIQFLIDNGYEVTRENMVDRSLSVRQQDI